MKQILRNRIKCKKCLDIIESLYTHDFKHCKCGSVFVDGGLDYCRYGFPQSPMEDWIEILTKYEGVPEND